jgi:hypothetical protein
MSDLSIDKFASISHTMSVHRTMFIKLSMSHNHTQFTCEDKKANHSIPTCHHCGISGHIRPNCFQICSQKPWNKAHSPRKDEPGFEEQVKKLSDHVKLISEKLAYLSPNEQRSVLVNNKKKASKQVWVKKEDNLCLVAHTALKILDTCLWYLDSGCSKHMTGDKTLLKSLDGQRRKDHLWRWEPIQGYWKMNHQHSRSQSISGSFVCGGAQGKSPQH